MSFLRQLVSAALSVAAYFAGPAGFWFYAAAVAVSAYDARREGKKAERAAREAYNASLRDRLEMVDVSADQARTIVLGRVRAVEGVRRRWLSGANDERLTMVVSFAGHEIDAFEEFYANDVPLTLDGSGWVQTAPYFQGRRETRSQTATLNGSGGATVVLPVTPVAGSVRAVWRVAVAFGIDDEGSCSVSVAGATVTLSGGRPDAQATVIYEEQTGTSHMRIRTWLGTAGQNVGAALAAEYPGQITSSDRFAGMAVAVVDLIYNPDVYPQGRPDITARLRGAKVYDPRKDSTAGGSGAHRLASPATWEWSENPALHALHYALHAHGWAVPSSEVELGDVISAANACDVSTGFTVRKPDNSTATVTLPRYRCGIVVPTDGDPRAAMDDIVATMAGRWGWAGGTLRMRAGQRRASAFALGDSWLAYRLDDGGRPAEGEPVLRVTTGLPRDRRVTRVTGTCVDPAQRYQVLPFPAIEDPVLIARDGYPLPLEVQFAGVNHPAHAQHLGSIMIRQAQAALRMELACNVSAWPLELFDTGTVTLARLGMAGKTVEVVGWRWHPAEGVQLQLAEITDAMFTPLPELRGVDPAPNTTLPSPFDVPAVTGLAASTTATIERDGSTSATLEVTWDAPTARSVTQGGWVELGWRYAGSSGPMATVRADTLSGHSLRGLLTGLHVLLRVRAVNGVPVRGDWSPSVLVQTAADTTAPPAATGLGYANVVGGQRVTWDRPTVRDYAESELRRGASYAAGSRLFVGDASEHLWLPPADGAYTLWLVHRDRTGNQSTPVSLAVDYVEVGGGGGGGSDGASTATVYLYQRTDSTSPPAVPAGTLTYDFVTGGLSGASLGVWSQTLPASGGRYRWVTQARTYAVGTVDTITPGEWATPAILSADGSNGAQGPQGPAGADAQLLYLAASSQVFQVAKNGTASPASITLTASQQNLAGTPSFSVTAGTATLTGSGTSRTLTYANLATDAATVQVSLGGLTDTVTIVKVREGSDGVVALLSNESHTVPAAADGSSPDLAGAVSTMRVFVGTADDSANWSFSRVNGAGVTSTIAGATVTVTGMTADSAWIDITATRAGFSSQTKRFTLAKSKAGADGAPGTDGKVLYLAATSQVVQVAKSGAASPSSVTLTAVQQGLGGTLAWSVVSGTATLTGSGSTRTLTYANLATDSATVQITRDGLTDTITIVKVREGADGVVSVLTNEAHTIPAAADGSNPDLAGASTQMLVFVGGANDSANWTFSRTNGSGVTSTISGGVVTVTGITVDAGWIDITATRSGYSMQTKRFTLTRTRTGEDAALVVNGGFEQGAVGWTTPVANASIINSPATAATGNWHARSQITDGVSRTITQNRDFPVAPGQRLELAAFVARSSAATGSAFVRIQWLDAAGVSLGFATLQWTTVETTADAYLAKRRTFTVPATAAKARVQIGEFSQTAGVWRYDDIVCSVAGSGSIVELRSYAADMAGASFGRFELVWSETITATVSGKVNVDFVFNIRCDIDGGLPSLLPGAFPAPADAEFVLPAPFDAQGWGVYTSSEYSGGTKMQALPAQITFDVERGATYSIGLVAFVDQSRPLERPIVGKITARVWQVGD